MTIEEIAQMAGVSRTAVSRYLNNGYVSGEKKEKIREAIEKTGYTPSRQARMLRTKKTNLIGVVMPKISSEAVSRIVSGISSELADKSYQILLADTENNVEKELEYLSVFKNNQVDGIIFVATFLNSKHTELLKGLEIPVVIVGQRLQGFSCIYHDDFNAARELTELMARRGRRRIAYIGVSVKDKAAGEARLNGYLEGLSAWGIEPDKELMRESDFTMDGGYIKMKSLLIENLGVDAVFCATDSIAVGAKQAITEAGLSIPGDISITGIGHTQMSNVITPKLATAHYFYKTSGAEAAKILLDMLNNQDGAVREIKLGYKVLEHESI